MITVGQLLKSKSKDVWSIAPDDSVFDALKLMSEKGVGALPVVESGELVGIVSERDYARKIVLKGKSSRNTPVEAIMTKDVVTIDPTQKLNACMTMMTEKRIRHLPVCVGGEMVGIISIGDVLKEIIAEQGTFIQDLQNYIEGKGYGQ